MWRRLLYAILIVVASVSRMGAQLPNGSDTSPAFEVASVRAAQPAEFQEDREDIRSSPGGLTMRHVSLSSCIKWAYRLNSFQIMGPDWLSSARFDIVAKAAGPVKEDQLRLMLQMLLADRFNLVFHRDKKTAQTYVLLVGRGGPKFHESQGEGASTMIPSRLGFAATRSSMSQLTEYLAIPLRRPVLDLTGLTGHYDFTLDLTVYAGRDAQPDDMTSLLLAALQEQLGLKLEARNGPVEVLIVDRVERNPTQN